MPDRNAIDRENRHHALALAVESHVADGHAADILHIATRYLEWLRKPTPAATLNLRVGEPIPR
jgi:hypothetical protein